MKIDWSALFEIAKAVVLLFCGGLVTRFFERRAKLVAYFEHVSAFNHTPPEGQPIQVFSHSVILRNAGKETATNVRIHHAVLPSFQIWPQIVHQVEQLTDGSKDIVIPKLVPKEQITISYLYFPPLTYDKTNAGIKCDQGFAQQIAVALQPKASKLTMFFVWSVLIIGAVTSLYLIFEACHWIQNQF